MRIITLNWKSRELGRMWLNSGIHGNSIFLNFKIKDIPLTVVFPLQGPKNNIVDLSIPVILKTDNLKAPENSGGWAGELRVWFEVYGSFVGVRDLIESAGWSGRGRGQVRFDLDGRRRGHVRFDLDGRRRGHVWFDLDGQGRGDVRFELDWQGRGDVRFKLDGPGRGDVRFELVGQGRGNEWFELDVRGVCHAIFDSNDWVEHVELKLPRNGSYFEIENLNLERWRPILVHLAEQVNIKNGELLISVRVHSGLFYLDREVEIDVSLYEGKRSIDDQRLNSHVILSNDKFEKMIAHATVQSEISKKKKEKEPKPQSVSTSTETKNQTVHIGASSPSWVKSGDEFTTRLVVYLPKFKRKAKAVLKQIGNKTHVKLTETSSWKKGVEVTVKISACHVLIPVDEQVFVWNGELNHVAFDLITEKDISTDTSTLLKFDLSIMDVVVARVRVPLKIKQKMPFFGRNFSSNLKTSFESAFQSCYASFEKTDLSKVHERINAISQHTGIKFFVDCLSLKPDESRKPFLKETMATHDLFMLFWSEHSSHSKEVEWEWRTALERPGKDSIETQRMDSSILPADLERICSSNGMEVRMLNVNKRFFKVGVCLSLFVAVLVAWAFFIGNLTPDQRNLIRILLSLASGFLAGCFIGAFTVNTKGIFPGIVATATGGYGVWLITALVLFPTQAGFGLVVQPHGVEKLDTLKSGTVVLQIGTELRKESLIEGQAHFSDLPLGKKGKKVFIKVEAPDFDMIKENQEVTLISGGVIYVPMKPKK